LKAIPSFLRRHPSKSGYGADRGDPSMLLQSFEKAADGWFWATDAQGRLTYLSDNIGRWLPGGAHKALGSDFTGLVQQPDLPSGIRRALPIMMSRQADFERVNLRLIPSEKENWWSVSGFAQFDGSGRFKGYTGFALDVTEQQQAFERATRLAMYDPLTGLPNRLSMARMLEAALADLDPVKGSCAVLMLDLDRFKQVNDTLGHPAGDTLLKQVAERILAIVGDENRVFRLGGDEFQIVLPKADDRSALGHLATKLIESLSQNYYIQGSRCVIGASIGIAIAPFDGGTSEELIRNADLALYAAKDGGRGRYRLFSDDLLKAAEEKRLLEDDLRDALAKGEIFLTYQPVVNATDNRLTGVEALIRWAHPKHGLISPSKFIAIAEENGLVEQLGTWALRQASSRCATRTEVEHEMKLRLFSGCLGRHRCQYLVDLLQHDIAVETIENLEPGQISQQPDFRREQVVGDFESRDRQILDPLPVCIDQPRDEFAEGGPVATKRDWAVGGLARPPFRSVSACNEAHRPFEAGELEIGLVAARAEHRPSVQIAMKHAFRMQRLERKGNTLAVLPDTYPVCRKTGSDQPVARASVVERRRNRPALARLDNEIETVLVAPRVNETRDNLMRGWMACHTVQLANLIAPDRLEVAIVLPQRARPDFDEDGLTVRSSTFEEPDPPGGPVGPAQIGIVNTVFLEKSLSPPRSLSHVYSLTSSPRMVSYVVRVRLATPIVAIAPNRTEVQRGCTRRLTSRSV